MIKDPEILDFFGNDVTEEGFGISEGDVDNAYLLNRIMVIEDKVDDILANIKSSSSQA
jgi:hypothetical protein